MQQLSSATDVVIIGGGPVGCATGIAFARKGARVTILEAAPEAARKRLAGEWMHPPGRETLEALGVDVHRDFAEQTTGKGFAVFPDDGSEPIVMPYAFGAIGFSCEHSRIVDGLRAVALDHDNLTFMGNARVKSIDGQRVIYELKGEGGERAIIAPQIVGADGRNSVARRALGLETGEVQVSRMAGVLIEGGELPYENFGHVVLGGPGPVLMYRVERDSQRLCIDVPLGARMGQNPAAYIWDNYGPAMPEKLREPLRKSLESRPLAWAANQVRLREDFGRKGLALVGDAIGHYHPMTAIGMTMGSLDAVALAEHDDFDDYVAERHRDSRTPALLAVMLYDAFAEKTDDTHALRQAVFRLWRGNEAERVQTMQYLACQDTTIGHFWKSFFRVAARATASTVSQSMSRKERGHLSVFGTDLMPRLPWIATSLWQQKPFSARTREIEPSSKKAAPIESGARSTAEALKHGVHSLVSLQLEGGEWEGEVHWCPMLTAQYVLMASITGLPISEERRRDVLKQFEATRLPGGTWGLGEASQPYLFVTTLVYVASRLLGVEADDVLLADARRMIRGEGGVAHVPTWGKFWLAMLNLYDWSGVNPVLPEAWLLPESSSLHPSNFYCHTRLIYTPMAYIYANKLQKELDPTLLALREELYPHGYDNVDFKKSRKQLRTDEVIDPPGRRLKMMYNASVLADRVAPRRVRRKVLEHLIERIHWELKTTHYTNISPVSGLLNMVALWHNDPTDPHLQGAWDKIDDWAWVDEQAGYRISGARSATWDTGFVLQTLALAPQDDETAASIRRGVDFLRTQQIRETFDGYRDFNRIDPKGGFCFAGVWHGWPVSDCTAEAIEGLMDVPEWAQAGDQSDAQLRDAVRFIMRCQNKDGGFGSYEARRGGDLEWMNPAEMFGGSMTEMSYPECTASCISALSSFRKRFGGELSEQLDDSIARGTELLMSLQRPDGSWVAGWGINFTYGTMFGVRGLLAGGISTRHPAIAKACRWLAEHQRADGGWGEHEDSCLDDTYLEDDSQVIQTAWALITLEMAQYGDRDVLDRAAAYLARTQNDDGSWPRQKPAGIFFRSAVLDYVLYRAYFPVWALGAYEARRAARLSDHERPARRKRKENVAQEAPATV